MWQPAYRYFLGFRPDPALSAWLASLYAPAGQFNRVVRLEHLHLTLCVIAELAQRDRFIAPRVDAALSGRMLASCLIRLSWIRGGAAGAALFTVGRQGEIQQLYRLLVACLAERRLFPLHRRSGLRPHVTLGYDICRFETFRLPREWVPDELLLIESEVGKGIHNVIGRWPLLPPPQGALPFDPALAPLPPVPDSARPSVRAA